MRPADSATAAARAASPRPRSSAMDSSTRQLSAGRLCSFAGISGGIERTCCRPLHYLGPRCGEGRVEFVEPAFPVTRGCVQSAARGAGTPGLLRARRLQLLVALIYSGVLINIQTGLRTNIPTGLS